MAEKVCIEFGTAGKAFDKAPASEIARILRNLADHFEQDGGPDIGGSAALADANGEVAGYCTVRAARRTRR